MFAKYMDLKVDTSLIPLYDLLMACYLHECP